MAKAPYFLDSEDLSQTNFDYSLLLIGMTGSGKTSVTNYLSEKKLFEEGSGLAAITKRAQHALCEFEGKKIFIVDCPGFCDTNASHETITSEIFRCAIWIHGGVDAVAIVVDISKRFSEDWDVGFKQIEQIGITLWKYTFVLFTHEKEILAPPTISKGGDYLRNLIDKDTIPVKLKELLVYVDSRFMCLDTSDKDPAIRLQHFKKLIHKIDKIRFENGNKKYTNKLISMFYEQHLKVLDLERKVAKLNEELFQAVPGIVQTIPIVPAPQIEDSEGATSKRPKFDRKMCNYL